ncbi:hypothetical protein [Bacteroides sp. 224]|uniref:hypothetical protein n=1 Tax=Bacteroides sp. 224 TaxID=2302936 RepID=UPI0013D3EA93|nr:hypothetical protein [Bacteroides sp. 224]NDV65123.1 hypothetical protein [Bacteroides sp. 224]
MKQLYLKILRCLLPVLFISYLAGITLFTHSHVVNGVTIVHSHPFNEDAEHSHSTTEFQLIHLLSQVLTGGAVILPLLLFVYYILFALLAAKPQRSFYHSPYQGVLTLRGPPAFHN